MIVRIAQPSSYPWICERVGFYPSSQFVALEAVRPDGSIAGMVGYDMWTPTGVSLHIAIESPVALRKLAPDGFKMAFGPTRQTVACGVRGDNAESLRLVKHLGFKEAGRLRGYCGGCDFVLFDMRRSECRWLEA